MAGITAKYPEAFERLWEAYPKWPKGRSVKADAYRRWKVVTRGWPQKDLAELVERVERQKEDRASWQPGDPYGPQGLQVWLNKAGWDHDYETIADRRRATGAPAATVVRSPEPWEQRGISKAEWDAEQIWKWRESMKLPQDHPTLEAARAAAREASDAE